MIDLLRRYRAIREPIRLAVGRLYAWIAVRAKRTPRGPSVPKRRLAGGAREDIDAEIWAPYDALSRQWATSVLEAGDVCPPFPPEDPEAKHDAVRMRGVLPALADVFRVSRSAAVADRVDLLLNATARLVDSDKRTGWDPTNAALRVISMLEAEEILARVGLSLFALSPWLREFVLAHASVLRIGSISEPEGNHEFINRAGRSALHILKSGVAIPSNLARATARTFSSQFLEDGGHVERSPHYHVQTMRLAELLARADERRGGGLRGRLASQITTSTAAIGAMLGPTGSPVRFGDGSRTFSGRRNEADVLELGVRRPEGRVETLLQFGLSRLCWKCESAHFTLVVDHGALGLAGNPGHGHDDMLSFCLWVDEYPLIEDPGTFLYDNQLDAMEFKLRRSHNCIDWPAHHAGKLSRYFRWRRIPAPARFIDAGPVGNGSRLHAEHAWRSGTRRFFQARTWIPQRGGLSVLDEVRSSGWERAVTRVNLPPGAEAQLSGANEVMLTFSGRRAALSMRGVERVEVTQAWHAPAYGIRVPAARLSGWFTSGETPTRIRTVIRTLP